MPEPLNEDRIRAIVADAVAAAFARNISPEGPQGPPGPAGPPGPQGPVGGNGNNGTDGNGTNGWRIEDLGYFNPDLSDPGDAPVKSLQNHTYYRDVYVFVERLKDLQAIKGEDLVRNNIHASLRGSALDWYTVELTDFERRSLRQVPLVDGWYTILVNRFKLRPSEALGKLTTLSFGPSEVQQGRSVRAFAQAVFRYSQAADIRSQYNQITQAWTKLHPNLRRDVPEPTEKTTIAEFLSQLEAKESIWRDIAAASNRRSNYSNRDREQPYSFNPNPSSMNNPYQPKEFSYSTNVSQRPYQNYPQTEPFPPAQQPWRPIPPPANPRPWSRPWNIQPQARGMPSPDMKRPEDKKRMTRPPPRMISDKPAYEPNENRYANKGQEQGNRRDWNRRPTAYQAHPEDAYNTWDKDLYSVQTPPDNLHDDHTENPSQEEAPFNDEALVYEAPLVDSEYPDEPEYPCWQCHTDFPSNNTLHKHIREQHSDAAVKHPTMTTMTISTPRDIVVSSTKHTGPAGYAFRSWKHVSTILILASKLTVDTCLDTGCAMTVIDKLLVKELGLTPKVTAPITVSSKGSRHESTAEYVIVQVDIPSHLGSKEKKSRVGFLSLLNDSPVKSPSRKRFATRILLEEASDPKCESFHELQKEFASAEFLHHHDYGPGIRLK